MDIRKAAREEIERREAAEAVDPVVYVNDWMENRPPMDPVWRRKLRAYLNARGVSHFVVEYVDDWRGDA